jgi:hypothetical protein
MQNWLVHEHQLRYQQNKLRTKKAKQQRHLRTGFKNAVVKDTTDAIGGFNLNYRRN